MSTINRVWDPTAVAFVRWETVSPDTGGLQYPGPDVFVNTLDYCVEATIENEQVIQLPVAPGLSVPAGAVAGLWLFDNALTDESANAINLSGVAPGFSGSPVPNKRSLWTDGSVLHQSPGGATSDPIRLAGNITVEALVRPDTTSPNIQYICSFSTSGAPALARNTLWGMFLGNGTVGGPNELYFNHQYAAGTGVDVFSGTLIPMGAWTHIAVTRTAAGLVRLYVNGLLVHREAVTPAAGGTDSVLWIADHPTVDRRLFGSISSLRVIDTVQRPEDIMVSARATLPPSARP